MSERAIATQTKVTSHQNANRNGLLQRQCACGNHTVAGGECAECSKKKHNLQRKLTIGASNDPLEVEADRIADQVLAAPAHSSVSGAPPRIQRFTVQSNGPMDVAPASVDRVLTSSGQPLDAELQQDMWQRFGHDFSRVRVHTDATAGQSAGDVGAQAYTVGNDIVFGAGRFAPYTLEGQRLLVHELVHTVQQTGVLNGLIQRKEGDKAGLSSGPTLSPAMPPRQNVCYFMGDVKKDPFFISAFRFFHSRFPNAVLVSNIRNLHDLLEHINTHFSQPLANIFIITHANEDGTVSFGFDKSDRDKHTDVRELKKALHPTGGGSSSLPSVGKLIDANTRIQIKGCDLGRTNEMLELIDEVFGGQGQVTAPTHEQGYYFNEKTTADSAKLILQEHMTQFDTALMPIPPMPDPVDKNLRGDAKKDAVRARQAAIKARDAVMAQRKKDADAERKNFRPEAHRLGEIKGSGDFLSGPLFQRQGDQLFSEAEIMAKVNALYTHLSPKQRESIAKKLVAPDKRPKGNEQGTYKQGGQRAYKIVPFTQSFFDPKTLQDAVFIFGKQFAKGFVPASMSTAETAGTVTITIQGKLGKQDFTMTFTIDSPPTDSELVKLGREQVNNPDKFDWSVETTNVRGKAAKKVIAKRVVAYLHHGSLDIDIKHRFTALESDPNFFSESTFAPPPTTP
jgi:Domain of unknown function (DUF4157)